MGSTSEFPPPRMGLTPKPSPVTEQNAPPRGWSWGRGLERRTGGLGVLPACSHLLYTRSSVTARSWPEEVDAAMDPVQLSPPAWCPGPGPAPSSRGAAELGEGAAHGDVLATYPGL